MSTAISYTLTGTNPSTWSTPSVSGPTIQTIRTGTNPPNSIDPGGTVAISFTATATTSGTKTWTTSAFGNTSCSPGQSFTISGPQPSVIVSAPPTIAINDVTVTEGNSGTTNAIFSVTLSAASSQTITVDFATADGTATTADNDYVAANGMV